MSSDSSSSPKLVKKTKCNAEGTAGLDPVTFEPLCNEHPNHPFVLSPDGTMTICYNESTLRKIAMQAGKWLQPPHFRTRMEDDLIKKCVDIGGELVVEEKPEEFSFAVDVESLTSFYNRFSGRLSVRNVSVCPYCFAQLKLLSSLTEPLAVITYFGLQKVPHFIFNSKSNWVTHMIVKHRSTIRSSDIAIEDYYLKQYIYDWLMTDDAEEYQTPIYATRGWNFETHQKVVKIAQKSQGDVRYYWSAHAFYHTILYNDLIDRVDNGTDASPLHITFFQESNKIRGNRYDDIKNFVVEDDFEEEEEVEEVEDNNESSNENGSEDSVDSFKRQKRRELKERKKKLFRKVDEEDDSQPNFFNFLSQKYLKLGEIEGEEEIDEDDYIEDGEPNSEQADFGAFSQKDLIRTFGAEKSTLEVNEKSKLSNNKDSQTRIKSEIQSQTTPRKRRILDDPNENEVQLQTHSQSTPQKRKRIVISDDEKTDHIVGFEQDLIEHSRLKQIEPSENSNDGVLITFD